MSRNQTEYQQNQVSMYNVGSATRGRAAEGRSAGGGAAGNLSDNPIRSIYIEDLMRNITYYKDCRIKDIARKAHPHFKNLTHLNLDFNDLGDEEIETIARALPHMENLTHFNLGDNRFSDTGAEALLEGLDNNYTIKNPIFDASSLCVSDIKKQEINARIAEILDRNIKIGTRVEDF